jgi:AcrR family transcriptional regulator
MDVNPRKFPRQARARATVEAIFTATAQILTQHGYEALTTARVAERAGISIGSFYQYFPNKQALAAAVVEHYGEAFASAFGEALTVETQESLADAVDAMIHAGLVAHPHTPELHRTLLELERRVGQVEKTRQLSGRVTRMIEGVLQHHRHEMAPDLDPADAAALIETLLETVAHRAIEDHPVRLANDRRIAQCRRLILSYLRSPVLSADTA